MKKHSRPVPRNLTPMSDVECWGCGWKGILAQAKQSIWLSPDPRYLIPASKGGNGKIWRCPLCTQKIFYVGYDNKGKTIAPSGHQYSDAVR